MGASLAAERSSFNDGSDTTFAPLINGCWTLAGGHGRDILSTFPQAFEAAADAGLDTFDTADIYGQSEAILGQLSEQRQAQGNARPVLFTKYVPNIFQQRPTRELVEGAVRRSMQALQVDSLDLVQMHWWDYGTPGMVDTALWLAELREKGLMRSVGVTNINTQALSQLIDAGVPVVCNQVQLSLLDRRPLAAMLPYCQERGVKVFTYGTLAGGLLSDRYVEQPKQGLFGQRRYSPIDLNTSSLKMYNNVINRAGGQEYYRSLLSALRSVADRRGCSVASIALAWARQQGSSGGNTDGSGDGGSGGGDNHSSGAVVHPIVGLRSPANLADNLEALGVRLEADDFAELDEVLARAKGPAGDVYSFERGE